MSPGKVSHDHLRAHTQSTDKTACPSKVPHTLSHGHLPQEIATVHQTFTHCPTPISETKALISDTPFQNVHSTAVISSRATICPAIATDLPQLPLRANQPTKPDNQHMSPKASVRKPTQSFLATKLGHLSRPQMTPAAAQCYPHLATLFASVTATPQSNCTGAKLPLTHGLHITQWQRLTRGHNDPLLVDHLTFGFPLGFATIERPQSDRLNHPSAQRSPQAVFDYLAEEIKHQAIAGPFDVPPFEPWFLTSPMMVRDKKGSTQKWVIVDLGWPIGRSVNANIPIDMYEGVPATMKLPTPMDLAQAIIAAPPTAHPFSLDLSRAYRQLRVDPQEWPLLGLTWNNQYYFDLSLAFGGCWHAAACQRVTEALQFILANLGIRVWPYLDDIVGLADDQTTAISHFKQVRAVMFSLGLQEATHKAIEPTQALIWIGIHFDITTMTMTIPRAKLQEALQAVQHWLTQTVNPV